MIPRDGPAVLALLCLGCKRCGNDYASQDHALLDTLMPHLALYFVRQRARQQAMLPILAGAREPGATLISGGTDVSLTEREREVLRYLAEGLANKQIARILGISVATVNKHVANVMAKLGACSRTQAVTIARRQGLLPSS